MSLGGPAFGFFACQKKLVRSMPDIWWVKRSIAKGAAASFSLSPHVSSIFAVKKRRRISVPAKPSARSRQRCSCLCSGRAACEAWPKRMFCALMTLLRACKRRRWRRFLAGPFLMSSCARPRCRALICPMRERRSCRHLVEGLLSGTRRQFPDDRHRDEPARGDRAACPYRRSMTSALGRVRRS